MIQFILDILPLFPFKFVPLNTLFHNKIFYLLLADS